MKKKLFNRVGVVIFCWVGPALVSGVVPAQAVDETTVVGAEQYVEPHQEEPEVLYEPEGSFFLGYRFLSREDSVKASEYVYPGSSLTFGMDLLGCPLPHRYHLNGEFLSAYDFYTDLGYAYKDLVQFRDILVGIHHNLDHFDYRLPGAAPEIMYQDRNLDDRYYVDYINNLFSLRLKAPDFPFHTFVRHRYVERNGDVEERFVLGRIGNLIKTSETRPVDWQSSAFTLGANSHLGPVEIEYSFDRADFDPGPVNVLYDAYPAGVVYPRPGDIYPHGLVPETESYANTLKVHTSYSGGIVASATLSSLSRQNNFSGTDSTTWKGAFDLSWIPDPVLAFFFKYRHKEQDMDNPDQVTLNGAVNALTYPVRQGISYERDQFSLTARYKPFSRLSLLSTYAYSFQKRKDIGEWPVLAETTGRHNLNLTAHVRAPGKLKFKAVYEYTHFDEPSYNTEPDSENRLRLTATYPVFPWMTLHADYVLARTERDDLRYMNHVPEVLFEGGARDGRKDRFLASLSAVASPKLTLSAGWAYSRWKVEQDLAFAMWSGSMDGMPFMEAAVPYADRANSFFLALHYLPREDITLSVDLTHTLSKGEYGPGGSPETEPLSLEEFSVLDERETVLTLEAAKKLSADWEVSARLYVDLYDDRTADMLDGELYVATFTLKRYF